MPDTDVVREVVAHGLQFVGPAGALDQTIVVDMIRATTGKGEVTALDMIRRADVRGLIEWDCEACVVTLPRRERE